MRVQFEFSGWRVVLASLWLTGALCFLALAVLQGAQYGLPAAIGEYFVAFAGVWVFIAIMTDVTDVFK